MNRSTGNPCYTASWWIAVLPLLLFFSPGCELRSIETVETVSNPAGDFSRFPNLHAEGDQLTMSWLETDDDTTHSLQTAVRGYEQWSRHDTVAIGRDWFVNWADFPSVISLGGTPRAAHWLHKIPGNTYSYNVSVSFFDEESGNWTQPIVPHNDSTATEHGFVSMIPWEEGKILAVWLDGRKTEGRSHEEYHDMDRAMTLRSAIIAADGSVTEEHEIDESVCDCCQTSLVRTPGGAVVAYRDRTGEEIRDIYTSVYSDGSWSEPKAAYGDNWKIGGCPVNGPALDHFDDDVVVTWFTGSDSLSQVKAAFSDDGGNSFGSAIKVDDGNPLGRVDAVMTETGSAWVSWIEKGDERSEIRVKRVFEDQSTSTSVPIAEIDESRSSGFPQMARSPDGLFFAWTQPGDTARVETALLPMPN